MFTFNFTEEEQAVWNFKMRLILVNIVIWLDNWIKVHCTLLIGGTTLKNHYGDIIDILFFQIHFFNDKTVLKVPR